MFTYADAMDVSGQLKYIQTIKVFPNGVVVQMSMKHLPEYANKRSQDPFIPWRKANITGTLGNDMLNWINMHQNNSSLRIIIKLTEHGVYNNDKKIFNINSDVATFMSNNEIFAWFPF
jgi:hypothetical protein